MPDLNSYLAAHYLTSDPKPNKKRKRKTPKSSEPSGLLIADDDDSGWTKPKGSDDEEDDRDLQSAVAGTSAEFRPAKKSSWKTVGAPASKKNNGDDTDAADAILADAAAESAAAAAGTAADEAPAVADDGDADVKMSDGTLAGLQSAKSISAQLARRRAEEMKELEDIEREKRARKKKKKAADEDDDEEDQVVLRDATGRRVDVSMARAEARRAAAEAEEKAIRDEEARKRALRGDVQLEEARKRKEMLEDAALMPLARGKDDEELNKEMKAARRWNDPMAQFLEPDDVLAAAGAGKARTTGGKRSRRPMYKGAAPPNRYGIRPGYRWDGVDRGTGFEGERFKALNRWERNKGLDYAWQMDE